MVHRLWAVCSEPEQTTQPEAAVAASVPSPELSIRNDNYLALVDWSGRQLRGDGAGATRAEAPPILARLVWTRASGTVQVLGIESRYWRAVGHTQVLVRRAAELGQRWLKGVRLAPQ